MVDDPTTTGPEEFKPAELAEALRGLMGAKVTEHWPFTLTLQCDVVFIVEEGQLEIRLDIAAGPEGGEGSSQNMRLPLSMFVAPPLLNAFLRGLRHNFTDTLRDSLAQEAMLHLRDVTGAMLTLMEVQDVSREDIIRDHLEVTTQRLRVNLAALPERPRGGAWTKIGLRDVVARAAARLCLQGITGRALNLDAVNAELRAEYGNQAPQSGEALRKQLADRGLSWRQIKMAAESYCRHMKAEAERQGVSPVSPAESPPETGDDRGPKNSAEQ